MVSEPSKPSPPPTALTAAQTPAASLCSPAPSFHLCECSHHQPPSQANLAAISPQRRSPDPAPSPAPSPTPSFPSPAQPPSSPAPAPSPAQPRSSYCCCTHPSSSDSDLCECSPPSTPSPAPSSYPALAAQPTSKGPTHPAAQQRPKPTPLEKALQTQLLPPPCCNRSVPPDEVAPALTVPVPSPVPVSLSHSQPAQRVTSVLLNGKNFHAWSHSFQLYMVEKRKTRLSVADYFGYLKTRWEELAQYEPLSDFPSDGAVESKRLDRRHTYQFLMGLKSDFETLRTQILNTSPLPSLYEAFCGWMMTRGLLLLLQGLTYIVSTVLQIAQLQSYLGLAPTFPSSSPTAALVAEIPTALHGPDFEIFAADNPIPPRPLPILEPSPPTPNDSLPPIDSQNPSPCAHAPLPASSLESSMSSPLVSDPPLLDIPLVCVVAPLAFSSFQ
ncbi:hypothetical protein Acr_01g0014410 [Actinidia rufa]|uniref:Uncharacterized protein n=1 Tax=Actinidia rufa TaxID=165716 RepID=A0A7J0E5U0_9ERIC|nr:hypothetical protein Acr_01g0014410 [Actinidia rufa]